MEGLMNCLTCGHRTWHKWTHVKTQYELISTWTCQTCGKQKKEITNLKTATNDKENSNNERG